VNIMGNQTAAGDGVVHRSAVLSEAGAIEVRQTGSALSVSSGKADHAVFLFSSTAAGAPPGAKPPPDTGIMDALALADLSTP
jgi:hypothetical protein